LEWVTLTIYDILGNEHAVLVNEEKPAWVYSVVMDNARVELTNGVFFYELKTGDFIKTRKMIVIK